MDLQSLTPEEYVKATKTDLLLEAALRHAAARLLMQPKLRPVETVADFFRRCGRRERDQKGRQRSRKRET